MAVITRETLVLRGVSVVRDGNTAMVRQGSDNPAKLEAPAFLISMRHPSPGCQGQIETGRHYPSDAGSRAGRSDSLAGVSVHRAAAIPSFPTWSLGTRDGGRSEALATWSLTNGCLTRPLAKINKRAWPTGRQTRLRHGDQGDR
jgi:hypothetical protein